MYSGLAFKIAFDEGARRGRTLEEAVQELDDGAGGQFDPRVVAALKRIADRGEIES